MAIKPNNEIIDLFTDYILETYILRESDFPHALWAEYSTAITLLFYK